MDSMDDTFALGAHWSLDDFDWVPHTLVSRRGARQERGAGVRAACGV
jgi:hypothetical protein